jgi:hypothetical protein
MEENYYTESYGSYPSHYYITGSVTLSKDAIEEFSVRIEGWSNRRLLIVDRENNVSYFQASAEGTDCHRCGICQKRMRLIGSRTGHRFTRIEGHMSLYQRLAGAPESDSVEGVKIFLRLPVVE